MKKCILILIFGVWSFGFSQNKQLDFEQKITAYFQEQKLYGITIAKPNFDISTGNLIEFDLNEIVLNNPYFSKKYANAEEKKEEVKNLPKSFSVIFENSLISLFENGKFVCFNIGNFDRNTELENKLNTKKFKYHWIIGSQLGGLSGNSIYLWNGDKWIKYKDSFPLRNQPKLFEDDRFIVFRDCFGEWGGTIYFFEKSTAKIYFTESTCANSVVRDENGYNVIAHLGHGFGFAGIKTIADPTKLSVAKLNEIGKSFNGEALGYIDKSSAFIKLLDGQGVQIFSSFKYQDKILYIVHYLDLTFIAEIKNSEIKIVNPLFFNGLYTHEPITTNYGDYTLINLDFYGDGLDRETSLLIIKENKITKITWNKIHTRNK